MEKEVKTFGLGDKQLKGAVAAYFGKAPNDAYLKSSTPWGDLYKKYDWPEVQLHMVAQTANILDMTPVPVIVKTQEFTNSSSKTGTFTVSIEESVTDTCLVL